MTGFDKLTIKGRAMNDSKDFLGVDFSNISKYAADNPDMTEVFILVLVSVVFGLVALVLNNYYI